MKVYVMTEAKLFGEERYVGVKKSVKEAEKCFRNIYPHMRRSGGNPGRAFLSDASKEPMLLFIHEEEI